MNTLERLSPDTILAEAQKRAEELLSIIEEKIRSLSKAPAGRIKLIRRGGNVHCYHVTDASKPAGKYIPVSEQKLIKALTQKEYDQTVLLELKSQLNLIDNFIKRYKPSAIMGLLAARGELRRSFITPVRLSDEEFAARWLAQPYKGRPFLEGDAEYFTSKGERVRSKSEMIIADILAKHGIPYKYECPLSLRATETANKGDGAVNSGFKSVNRGSGAINRISDSAARKLGMGRTPVAIYPDFTCLNLRTREEFLWEHLGRMDDPEYGMKTVRKMRTYRKNGRVLGRNLLVTMECDGHPLDRKDVESLVRTFLQ